MSNNDLSKRIRGTYRTLIVLSALILIVAIGSIYFFTDSDTDLVEIEPLNEDSERIENGVHVRTGFVEAPGMQETINNCTSCHSSQLVIQNRMNEERWATTIDWMQETQNLWDLGANEEIIINYLVKNYPVSSKGRREALTHIEWYELKD